MQQQGFKILIPIVTPSYSCTLNNCTAVKNIISPMPQVDMTDVMKRSYQSYVKKCRLENTPLKTTQSGRGENIEVK